MNINKLLSILIAVMLCAGILAGCGSTVAAPAETAPAAVEAPAEITVEAAETAEPAEMEILLSITYASGTIEEHSIITTADNLYDAIKDVIDLGGYESQYGFFIESVNSEEGIYADDGTYWAIYVNGEYGMFSVDTQPIEDGCEYALVHESA